MDVLIEQELSQIIRAWNEYLSCEGRDFSDRSTCLKMLVNPWENVSSKLYIEIVYVIDFLVVRRHQEFLKHNSFKVPILMSVYILISISVGDVHLKQNYLWPFFERFLGRY